MERKLNKKLGQKLSALKSKEQKLERLQSERDNLRGDLDRGYRIVEDAKTEKREHIQLSPTDRKVHKGKMKALDNDIFDTSEEIRFLKAEVNELQHSKFTAISRKLQVKKLQKTVDQLTIDISSVIDESKNDEDANELEQIKEQVRKGENDTANKSLIHFLGTRNNSIKKRLDKSRKEVREEAISNTLQKLTVS